MTPSNDKHTYIAIYNGRQHTIASSSLYAAKLAAVEHFKAPKSKQSQIGIYLACTADGQDVNIIPQL